MGHRDRLARFGSAGQAAELHREGALADRQLTAQFRLAQAAAQRDVSITDACQQGQGEGRLAEHQLQGPLHLGGYKQGQLATARQLAAAADPGRELLELEVLKIEQHHGLEIADRLASHGEGAIAAAQEAIGDRFGDAAPHQQLQVSAAGGPAQPTAGQAREETQAIAAAGQAQFQPLAARIEGDAPLEINVVRGPLAAQGEVEGDGLVLELQGAALQGQGLVAQAAVLQLQFAPEPGPGAAQPVAPGGGQPAPERGW